MLKRLRKPLVVLIGAMLAVAVAGFVLAWSTIRQLGPEELRKRITAAVKAETGLDLMTDRLTTTVSYHVNITLDSARLLDGNRTVARFGKIRLTCGYRTLLFHGGLPFLAVSLNAPKVVLPLHSVTPGPMPVLDPAAVRDLRRILVRLSNVARVIAMSSATVEDRDGRVLFDEAAVRATHSGAASAWRLRLMGLFTGVDLPNFKLGASMIMAPEIDGNEVPFARGSLWFWDANLHDFTTRGLTLGGRVKGNLTFLVRTDGTVIGQVLTRTQGFRMGGPFLAGPVELSELIMSARLAQSVSGLQMTQFAMRSGAKDLLSGSATVEPLSPDDLHIRARISPFSMGAEQIKSLVRRVRGLPIWAPEYAQKILAGRVGLEQLSLDTTLKELEAPSAKILLHQTTMKASLDGLAWSTPEIPPIAELDGRLDYAGGLLRLSQSHASLGTSTLNEILVSCDISGRTRGDPYQVKVAGDLDAGEIFAVARKLMDRGGAGPLKRIEGLNGRTAAEVEMHGELNRFAFDRMPDYLAVLHPHDMVVGVAAASSEFKVNGGTIRVSPDAILIDQLQMAPRHGSMKASARIKRVEDGSFQVVNLAVELKQIKAEEWLPHLIDMDTIQVKTLVNGTIGIKQVQDGGVHPYQVDGQLALGPGDIKFAFLRAPVMLTDPATLTMEGHGGSLVIKSGSLEHSPLDMSVSVADVSHPLIKIQAHAQQLDLETITAVRLPWTPETPIKIDNTALEGHIEADQARLSRLEMKNLKASFRRDSDTWRVFDINADAMDGHLNMDLAGERRDDWVHIIIGAHAVDAVAVQALAGTRTVVTGRISANADLWADTNDDFYQTLTGSMSTGVENGVLLKFKLLSRLLSLVAVSEWLNAEIPDPRVNGVPFRSMTAQFSGERGSFETNNFMLDGPVMKITAAGKVNVNQSTMNMMIGMRPFQLLDTVFNKIPVIGNRLAESQSGIVAGYFHVQGPIGDPSVVPAPITSISHLLIKTLAIPINLLVPETVK